MLKKSILEKNFLPSPSNPSKYKVKKLIIRTKQEKAVKQKIKIKSKNI